ncbi:MAG: GntR family transcriptional regulator [Verrucomicrobia bacterium]|nr:GntR family transcriptional regulator [Verrucomicrobiota bacterium]
MANIGKRNVLTIVRGAPPGFYLDGGTHGEILLPGKLIPPGATPGGTIDVFVYRDSEDRLVATPQKPLVMVGQFAMLRVVSINPRIGVFLDWGLDKDLLLPMRETFKPVSTGEYVLVQVVLDEKTDRLIASARLNRRLAFPPVGTYKEGDSVNLIVMSHSELGYNMIVNDAHRGLLYDSDAKGRLEPGDRFDGYVRTVRPDGKIDVALGKSGYRRIAPLTDEILAALVAKGGRLPFNDNSSPEAIREYFGVSKKAFKQAIGSLFRERRIYIDPDCIRIVFQKPER